MLESVSRTTFSAKLEHFSEVMIGNENSSRFEPHLRLKRWGEECHLGFGIPTRNNIAARQYFDNSLQTDVIEWIDTDLDRKYRFYTRPKHEILAADGGFEFEIWLASPPSAPYLDFPVEVTHLDLFFQPPLRPGERGVRGPKVVGSYAAYHSTCGQMHVGADGEKYRTGKAFHLYRPEAVDAHGRRWWLDLLYNPRASTFQMVLGPEFQSAAYPVCIDPDIGYTSNGGTQDDTENFMLATLQTTATAGDAAPGTATIYANTDSGTANVYLRVYAYNASGPFGQAAVSGASNAIALSTTLAQRSAAITWNGIAASTNYWMTNWSNTAGVNFFFDAGGNTGWYNVTLVATPPDPCPAATVSGAFDNRLSQFVTYTASGGGGGAPTTLVGRGMLLSHQRNHLVRSG